MLIISNLVFNLIICSMIIQAVEDDKVCFSEHLSLAELQGEIMNSLISFMVNSLKL